MDRFSWNLIQRTSTKFCLENSDLVKIRQKQQALYVKTLVPLWLLSPPTLSWFRLLLIQPRFLQLLLLPFLPLMFCLLKVTVVTVVTCMCQKCSTVLTFPISLQATPIHTLSASDAVFTHRHFLVLSAEYSRAGCVSAWICHSSKNVFCFKLLGCKACLTPQCCRSVLTLEKV